MILRSGENIIAFGKVFYDKKLNKLRMIDPSFFLKTKSEFVWMISKELKKLKKIYYLSGIFMGISTILIIRRICILTQKFKKSIEQRILLDYQNKFKGIPFLETERLDCIECKKTLKNMVYLPCYHMEYCNKCMDTKSCNLCSFCGEKIQEKVRIYIC